MYEEWKSIDYDPRYEVSNLGRFRKKNKVKGYRYLKPFRKWKRPIFVIKINGKEFSCARLVASKFIRPLKEGEVVHHKNRLEFDNYYRNLEIMSKKKCGEITGFVSGCRRVVLIENGKIKKSWRSTRKAQKELFVSRETISNYCNGKVKKPMYNLMWEEDYFEKLEKEGR